MAWIDAMIAAAGSHPALAFGAAFLAALLEAAPVVGSVMPGSTLILALSALVATGGLDPIAMIAAAFAGAAIGDGAAYLVGRRYQRGILAMWPLSRHPTLVAHSEAFFLRHGAAAVFFARFVPPVRAVVPITAGALGLRPPRFFGVNIPATALWAVAHVVPGVVAGAQLERAGAGGLHHLGPLIGGALATGLLALWVIRHWRRRETA